jgi:hypothetical protein
MAKPPDSVNGPVVAAPMFVVCPGGFPASRNLVPPYHGR